jgi:S1-C subfamily serine protease
MGFYGIYQGIDLSDAKYVKAISTQMSDLGYKVVGTNAMFSGKSDVADLALGGEVVWFAKDTRGSGFQISVIVHWTVFDVKKENIVFELTTAGYSDTKVTLLNEELSKAFQDATRGLLNDAKFKELAVKKGDDVNAKGEKEASLELPKIAKKTYASYGDMVKNVVNACLTVKTNFGHGSGFLVSEDGYVLTNNHVVSGADKIDVVFDNGFSFEAKLIKANDDRDVALLKISGSGFKALPLGTSDDASVGTEVVAIGTPQDIKLGQTVTKGIVSGKREMEEKNFIQTDVAINSGNSGGPLINSSGEVIGIIVAKVFGKSVEGLGFAIPINEAIKKLNLKLE